MIKRKLEAEIISTARSFPVIAIIGPRQSGKTTTAQMVFPEHAYLSLEDLDLQAAARKDPRTFLIANATEQGMIIDEFQHVPELLSYIQTIVDKDQKPGYFVLTGSQNFLMNESITQSLAGRVAIHTLLPLSTSELKDSSYKLPEIEPMLFQGCYPAIYSKKMDPKHLYQNYLRTYVERDVRQLAQVGDLATFQTFMILCAARVGQILNVSSLGNDCNISNTTAERWLSILQASYVIFLLKPYHKNFGKRLIKSPKLYFYDSGLACHLLRIKREELATHPNRGNLFESFVLSEILKSYYNRGDIPPVYFWRDKMGHEVDCIIEDGQKLIPIEIKSSRTINSRFFENLQYWNKITGVERENVVIYAGSSKQPTGYANVVSWEDVDKIL